MNRNEMKKAVDLMNKALRSETTNFIAYCPICLSMVSVKEESEESVTIECVNTKCPMISYTLDLKKLEEFNE